MTDARIVVVDQSAETNEQGAPTEDRRNGDLSRYEIGPGVVAVVFDNSGCNPTERSYDDDTESDVILMPEEHEGYHSGDGDNEHDGQHDVVRDQ